MPPKKAKTVRIKEPEVSEDEEDDQKEAAALKKESGAQIVRNLLEKDRISTPHPNTPFVKWAEWTCLHCDETYYPAQNYETTEKRDSDITSPIVKHFAKKHGNGPDSAYAEAPSGPRHVSGRPEAPKCWKVHKWFHTCVHRPKV